MSRAFNWQQVAAALGVIVAIGFLVNATFQFNGLRQERDLLNEKLAGAGQDLMLADETNKQLMELLRAEQSKNLGFEVKISEITGIVGNLQKLAATDPELLKKYSKVYFLSENYAPAQLSSIDPQYLYEKNRPQLIHTGALPKLQDMIGSAQRDGITMQVVSGYRSFYEQAAVKEGYKVTYGSGANQFSADQGYSEHQLGTAVDFTTTWPRPERHGR